MNRYYLLSTNIEYVSLKALYNAYRSPRLVQLAEAFHVEVSRIPRMLQADCHDETNRPDLLQKSKICGWPCLALSSREFGSSATTLARIGIHVWITFRWARTHKIASRL